MLKTLTALLNEPINGINLSVKQKAWLLSLPWENSKVSEIDLMEAEEILNESHFGTVELKQRIMEYITMQNHLDRIYSSVLLLVGPPGIDKTCIAKAITDALNREFIIVPLNDVSAAFELKGYYKTWKNAQPGLIVKAIIQSASFSSVILLDEIDKIGKGETFSSAETVLIEILDSDRTKFLDQFLEVPIDLSKIIFIATANSLDPISPILLNRLEILNLQAILLTLLKPDFLTSQ